MMALAAVSAPGAAVRAWYNVERCLRIMDARAAEYADDAAVT